MLLSAAFHSDVGRIKQILMNLISNSYKFTNQGGIELRLDISNKLEMGCPQRYLEISVVDTGVGISEADQANLFKVFGMVAKHRAQFNMRGTGLGLTITQKLVHLLGGTIELQSQEGAGTTVSFTIREKEP